MRNQNYGTLAILACILVLLVGLSLGWCQQRL